MRSGGSSGVPYGRLDWDTSQQIPRIRRSSELAAEVEDHLVSARRLDHPPQRGDDSNSRIVAARSGPLSFRSTTLSGSGTSFATSPLRLVGVVGSPDRPGSRSEEPVFHQSPGMVPF